jgi:hypothetical protein
MASNRRSTFGQGGSQQLAGKPASPATAIQVGIEFDDFQAGEPLCAAKHRQCLGQLS